MAALAEMQYQRTSDRLTVIYLLDQSLSIPEARRAAMIRYVNASIREQRQGGQGGPGGRDRVRPERRGRSAAGRFQHSARAARSKACSTRDYTNLAGAMQRAMAMFPHDAAKRIVLVTDGNQNVGDALEEARAIADAGVSIDVMPVPLERQSEVAVEKVALPADVRRGPAVRSCAWCSTIRRRVGRRRQGGERADSRSCARRATARKRSSMTPIDDRAGQDACSRSARKSTSPISTPTKRASCPTMPTSDALTQNNLATAFTHVQGKGQVLVIENWETPGEFDYLVERLRDEGLEVVVQPSNRLFTSLPELQRYDTVILADVPRSSGEDAASVSSFSDEQIKHARPQHRGAGLRADHDGRAEQLRRRRLDRTPSWKRRCRSISRSRARRSCRSGRWCSTCTPAKFRRPTTGRRSFARRRSRRSGRAIIAAWFISAAPINGCGASRRAAWCASGRIGR